MFIITLNRKTYFFSEVAMFGWSIPSECPDIGNLLLNNCEILSLCSIATPEGHRFKGQSLLRKIYCYLD